MKKTKFLVTGVGNVVLTKFDKYPCTVCFSGVGSNLILCWQCRLWVRKFSGTTKRLGDDSNYVCPRCNGCWQHHAWCGGHFLLPRSYAVLWWGLWQCRCCRCYVAWRKLRKLLPNLNTWHLLPRICCKVYKACFHSAMLHGSETGDQITLNCSALQQWLCLDLLDLWHWRQRWNALSFTTTETWH